MSGRKKRSLIQKLAKHNQKSRKIPAIPAHYFNNVPPPTMYNGKAENPKHYKYKIFLGESIKRHAGFLGKQLVYDYEDLPEFWHNRHGKNVHFIPDIFIKWVDEALERVIISDIEINGLIHYKNKTQILKNIERKNLVYPYLRNFKEPGYEDYPTVASYIIIDVDDFEYRKINEIISDVDIALFNGVTHPLDMDLILTNYLKA